MSSLASKVFVITGGASGIGLQGCRILAQSKVRAILIADWNERNFDSIREELRSISTDTVVHTSKLDVTVSTQVDLWIDEAILWYGRLDGAVNAAGIAQSPSLHEKPNIVGESNDV